MRPYRATPIDKPIDSEEFVYGWFLKNVHGQCFIARADDKSPPITANRVKSLTGTHDMVILGACEVHPSTVGQQIGLKDKNGKEIYEGDICKETKEHFTDKPSEDGWKSNTLPIEFHDGGFMFGYHTNELSYFVKHWGLKIIGTIHKPQEEEK